MAIESQPEPMTPRPPRMFPHPTEAPAALDSVRGSDEVTRLHRAWAHMAAGASPTTGGGRVRAKARGIVQRFRGQAEHELLGDLIRAVDSLAVRCDELTNRLQHQQAITGELAESLGQEVTRLRAALTRLPSGDEATDGLPAPRG